MKTKRLLVVVCLLACLGAWTQAFGQLDPGLFQIFQDGRLVGYIYVPLRSGQTTYAEHWVLLPGYVYPGTTKQVKTQIVADYEHRVSNEKEFFATVPFGTGSRYVLVAATETDQLPGRCGQ